MEPNLHLRCRTIIQQLTQDDPNLSLLQHLNLAGSEALQLSESELVSLAEAVKVNSNFTGTIDISCNDAVNDYYGVFLSSVMKHNNKISGITLSKTRIGDKGVRALCTAFSHGFRSLNLESTAVTDDGISAVCFSASKLTTIEELHFGIVGLSGLKIITNFLAATTSLGHLSFSLGQADTINHVSPGETSSLVNQTYDDATDCLSDDDSTLDEDTSDLRKHSSVEGHFSEPLRPLMRTFCDAVDRCSSLVTVTVKDAPSNLDSYLCELKHICLSRNDSERPYADGTLVADVTLLASKATIHGTMSTETWIVCI
eukprot:GHVQ01012809.1.p1 GENE.GHVQ01012809.1~~GHVQ01012809.1.p1  ORF type:complete len:313 (-),score=32.83 GHVQ01012809.1:811-1749(-)